MNKVPNLRPYEGEKPEPKYNYYVSFCVQSMINPNDITTATTVVRCRKIRSYKDIVHLAEVVIRNVNANEIPLIDTQEKFKVLILGWNKLYE